MKQLLVKRMMAASLAAATLSVGVALGADTASQADQAFVGKVSQGGLYEVEAGRVAAVHGTTPFIKNFGLMESHDHAGVNSGLRRIAGMTGVAIKPGLNEEFTARLNKLKATPAAQFDAYYLDDMKQIHNKDEGLFVDEASGGSGAYKPFAHATAMLVKAHLGWLNTM